MHNEPLIVTSITYMNESAVNSQNQTHMGSKMYQDTTINDQTTIE